MSDVVGTSGHLAAMVHVLAALGRDGADAGRLTLYLTSFGVSWLAAVWILVQEDRP